MSVADIHSYLRGEFYHGTARKNLSFSPTSPAYFTQDKAIAIDYAQMDAEIDDGIPHLICVRLDCTKPAIMDLMKMQDLHLDYIHGNFVKGLLVDGYDCAVANVDGHDEVAVLDPSKIEVLGITNLALERDAPAA